MSALKFKENKMAYSDYGGYAYRNGDIQSVSSVDQRDELSQLYKTRLSEFQGTK